jgi:hypothetical protein
MLIQQGDVLFEKVKEIPEGLDKSNSNILAEGEATGHAHTIDLSSADVYCDEKGTLYVNVVGESAVVDHQEHKKVSLPKGSYRVKRVMEYDHFKNMPNRVAD